MDKLPIINRLVNDFNTEGYLVGGVIRDLLMDKQAMDIDLVVKKQVREIAAKFAAKTEGSFVALDEEHKVYRVVIEGKNYDFSLSQSKFVTEDLLQRDFTINACALPLNKQVINRLISSVLPKEKIIDPTTGKKDIREGIIQVVKSSVFSADPLRLLRAVRFKAQFQFTVEKETEQLMSQAAEKIVTVAEERLTEELIKILQYPDAAHNLAYLEGELGLLSVLIADVSKLKDSGQCKYHREDIWTHSIYTVEKVEQLKQDEFWQQRIKKQNWPLLKLAALFHDVGKLLTKEVVNGKIRFYGHQKEGAAYLASSLDSLSFSGREMEYLTTLVRYHMRPLNLYSADNLTFKGKYRFFRAVEEWTADVCLLAVADMLSTVELNKETNVADSRKFLRQLVTEQEEQAKKTEPRLVSGDDIMEIFSLPEGPQIGNLLAKVRKAQAAGEITTREEAIKYLQEIIDN